MAPSYRITQKAPRNDRVVAYQSLSNTHRQRIRGLVATVKEKAGGAHLSIPTTTL